jgi:hypothetical protein
MSKSKMRVKPSLMWILLGTILLSPAILIVWPESKADKRARIIITRVWEKQIATFFRQHLVETGSLANFNNHSVFSSAFGTNNFKPQWTNSQGEIVDYWKKPFQIEIATQTNFIIRSAGPNQKFGDADDIVFNSVSNDFVKP